MSGSDWSLVILGVIGMIQVLGLALIQRGRKEDKTERAHVAEKVEETAVVAATTQTIVKETHDLSNSRYTELQDELRRSNERIITLLREGADRRRLTDPQSSEIIATELPDDTGTREGAP